MCDDSSVTDEEPFDPLFVAVAGRLKVALKKKGLTQEKIAAAIGHAQPNVSDFLNGKKGFETPMVLRILQLSAEHGVNLNAVFTGHGSSIVDISTDDANMAAVLRKIADRLVTPEGAPENDSPPRKAPRAPGKRR